MPTGIPRFPAQRCWRPMERREIPGEPYEEFPHCGRPKDHNGQCLSAACLARRAARRAAGRHRDRGNGSIL